MLKKKFSVQKKSCVNSFHILLTKACYYLEILYNSASYNHLDHIFENSKASKALF